MAQLFHNFKRTTMKKHRTLILILTSVIPFLLNAQGWAWKQPVPRSNILVDANKNLYAYRSGTNTFTLDKFSTTGTLLFTKNINGIISVKSVRIAANNDVVLLGNIDSPATIDNYTITPQGSQSFFILRLSSNGVVQQVNVYGNNSKATANCLSICANGDYLVGGSFKNSLTINSFTIQGDTLPNGFLFRMTTMQNVLWTEKTSFYTSNGDQAWIEEVSETSSGNYFIEVGMLFGLVEFNGYQFSSSSGVHMCYLNANHQIQSSKFLFHPSYDFFYPETLNTLEEKSYVKSIYNHHTISTNVRSSDTNCNITEKDWDARDIGYTFYKNKVLSSVIQYEPDFYNSSNAKSWLKISFLNPDLSLYNTFVDSTVNNGYLNGIQVVDSSSIYLAGELNSYNFIGKYSLNLLTSSIKKIEQQKGFSFYPNPASRKLFVRAFEPGQEVKIYSAIGSVAGFRRLAEDNSIDISELPAGVYILEILGKKEKSRTKFIKE